MCAGCFSSASTAHIQALTFWISLEVFRSAYNLNLSSSVRAREPQPEALNFEGPSTS